MFWLRRRLERPPQRSVSAAGGFLVAVVASLIHHGRHHMVWAVLNEAQNKALREIATFQSDRVAVVLGAAMLDDSLRHALEYRLRKSTVTDRIFGPNGALGNTAAKTEIAYLLYMIQKPMMHAMQAISDLRIYFAHDLSASFDNKSKRISNAFAKLTLHEKMTHYPSPDRGASPSHEIEAVTSRQAQFVVNLKLALHHLMRDFERHYPYSNSTFPAVTLASRRDSSRDAAPT